MRRLFFGGKKRQHAESSATPETPSETLPLPGTEEQDVERRSAEDLSPVSEANEPGTKRRFGFVDAKIRRTTADPLPSPDTERASAGGDWPQSDHETHPSDRRGLLPGSDGEHRLQCQFGSDSRAHGFYARQVLDYLSPTMQEFIARQEMLFVATADRHGECDCTSKFGRPGFIRVLNDKYLMYPEYRGNGVFANLGNITENPHIAMLILDLYRDTVGLHVNGKARIVEHEELSDYREDLPPDVMEEIALEGKKQPERWVMVEVEEAYIQCSKHIPLVKKLDKRIEWGTDNVVAKGGDYFRLQEISLYDRVGGDKAMEKVVNVFYRKVLQDELVSKFFADIDVEAQRLKQKSFLAMAFGGPYQYSGKDMREVRKRLVDELGLAEVHFDRVIQHFRETVLELHIPEPETEKMCEILQTFRDDVLNR